MCRRGKSSQNGQVPSKGRSPGRDICFLTALSLGSQQECCGRRELGEGKLASGERSPQLPCLLTVIFCRAGIQHKQLPKCLPNFLCLADGVRTFIMGKQLNLSDPGFGAWVY